MKRLLALCFLFAATLWAQPVKIGVLLPLSGAESWWGEPMRDSILLAYEDLGLKKENYELIFEDWEGNWTKLPLSTKKLLEIDKVDALINSFDKAGYIVAPMAKRAKVPHLVLALDDRCADGEFNYAVWTPVSQTTRLLLQKAHKEGHRKLALFILKDYFPYRSELEIKKQLKDFPDMKIVYSSQFDPSVRDFRTFSLKAQQSDWDLGIILGYPPAADLLYKQLRTDLPTRTLTSDATFDMFSDFSIVPEGSWWVGAAENTPEFNASFKKHFGYETFTGVTYSYDCLKLLVAAFEKNREHPELVIKNTAIEGAGGETYLNNEGIGQMKGYLKWREGGATKKSDKVE